MRAFLSMLLLALPAATATPSALAQQPAQGPCVQPTLACPAPQPLRATTGSLGGSALTIGTCSSVTVAVPFATTSMVAEATPQTDPGDAYYIKARVSAAGVVTVKICSTISGTPTTSLYNVAVLP